MINFEEKLTARLLRSAHRAATPEEASYIYLPGTPLVTDGHRMLARLWYVRQHWRSLWDGKGDADAGGGSGGGGGNHSSGGGGVGASGVASDDSVGSQPRVILLLPTERASSEALQLSVYPNDREVRRRW